MCCDMTLQNQVHQLQFFFFFSTEYGVYSHALHRRVRSQDSLYALGALRRREGSREMTVLQVGE